MDDGFKDRLDKVFASITSSSSSSSIPWSLSTTPHHQPDHHHHNRDEDDDDDDDDVDVDDQTPAVFSSFPSECDDDWDLRSSIGLDSTLDNEQEEDAYDMMAQGRDDSCAHRLYMKDVACFNSHIHHHPPAIPNAQPSAGIIRIKSILKRKPYAQVPKPAAKRVRFHSTCKNAPHPEGSHLPENGPGVPDYILNPSKYTRYSFHDGSNTESSYLEEQIKKAASENAGMEHKSCHDLPKSIVFIPRKKREGALGQEQTKQSATHTTGIAAVQVQQGEMQEDDKSHVDDVCTKTSRQKQPLRQYRSKLKEEYDDVS